MSYFSSLSFLPFMSFLPCLPFLSKFLRYLIGKGQQRQTRPYLSDLKKSFVIFVINVIFVTHVNNQNNHSSKDFYPLKPAFISPLFKRNKAGYTAISCARLGRGSNAQKSLSKKNGGQTDRPTDRPTDRQTDGHTLL